ncbi:protein mmf1, mitochondrial [Aspergillus lentulus]|uniref:Protein mmf1, mitochondrial n=1 Tax=Aspergillus lentulus TaxID=293939 RepID=A0ABQ1AHC9_ASPLE|nr:protein mmf1, mitochondrial [Aspergillus lentulus]
MESSTALGRSRWIRKQGNWSTGMSRLTRKCIKNLTHVLEAAGTTIDKVVKVNVFLSDMDNFADMNSVYMQYWGDVKPCRTCVAVKTLPLNTDVEIECIAVL